MHTFVPRKEEEKTCDQKKKPIPKIEAQHEKDHQTDMLKKYSNTNNNYSVWSARGSNQQATILEANTLSITPGK